MKNLVTRFIALAAISVLSFSTSAGSILSVSVINSDVHLANGGIGTFKTGDSLTVTQNGTTLYDPNPYVVPTLGISTASNPVYAFSDRNHVWVGYGTSVSSAPDPANFPGYLMGLDYVMTMNGNRDNAFATNSFSLTVTTSGPGTAYLFLDNRLGDGANLNGPTLTNSYSQWIINDGWTLVNTGLKPADYLGDNDILAIDESNNGGINQYMSIYSREITGDSFTLGTFGEGRNMYGAAFAPAVIPEPSVLALWGVGVSLVVLLRRRR